MKVLLFVLVFLPVVSFSQVKGDTKIIVTPTDTANLLQHISAILYERGFVIDRKDEQFAITREKPLKRLNGNFKVRVLLKGKKAVFSSLWNLPSIDTMFDEVKWRKSSPLREAWDETEYIAKQIGTIEYGK